MVFLVHRVATATLVEELYNLPRNTEETSVKKAKRCQKAEHDFTGTPCGIMDQYISALGKEGNLLLIDCRSNKATLVPSGAGPAAPLILVTNSNVKHSLSGSEYPDRVRQCKEAVEVLKKKYPEVRALRDASMEMLDDVKIELSEVVYCRAKHVIGENKRTTDTVDALRRNDFKRVGELMNESHNSLRDDYEVSCVELDCLVRIALEVPGVYGSRMTGGGFGGCTVTLVERSAVKDLEKLLHDKYQQEYATDCTCYEAVPSAGAGIMSLKEDEDGCESSATFNWIDYAVPGLVAALSVGVAVSFFLRRK
jgi:galactokinase